MSLETSFLLHDTELSALCWGQTLPSPVMVVPEMTDDPFGSGGSGHTTTTGSRGHRDRQQTRQLRKDFTLLFSIINEQQSQQIRTEGGWGLSMCCSGAGGGWGNYTGPDDRMLHTHRPFKVWLCIVDSIFVHAEMPLRGEGAERHWAYIAGSEVHLYVGGIMRAETYSSAATRWTTADKCSRACWTIEQESTLHFLRLQMTCASGLCKKLRLTGIILRSYSHEAQKTFSLQWCNSYNFIISLSSLYLSKDIILVFFMVRGKLLLLTTT